MSVVYLIGSLRHPSIPEIAERIEKETPHEAFADWWAAGKEADDAWQDYCNRRELDYVEALNTPASWHVFGFDYYHLMRSDVGVLVMPAGKSAHLELGYLAGKGKRCYVLFDQVPERYDQMYHLIGPKCQSDGVFKSVFFSVDALIGELNEIV